MGLTQPSPARLIRALCLGRRENALTSALSRRRGGIVVRWFAAIDGASVLTVNALTGILFQIEHF